MTDDDSDNVHPWLDAPPAQRGGHARRLRPVAMQWGGARLSDSDARRRVERILAAHQNLLQDGDDSFARAWHDAARGISYYWLGNFKQAFACSERAEQLLRERCVGRAYEESMIRIYRLFACVYLGKMREVASQVPDWLNEALRRGDLFTATMLRMTLFNLACPGGCVAALSMRHGPCGDFAEYSTAPELYVTAECTSANGGSWAGFEILLPDIRTLGPGTYPIGVSSSGGLSSLNGSLTVEKLTGGAAAYPDIVTGDFDAWFRLDVSGPGDAGKRFEASIIFDLKAAQIHAYPGTTCTVYAC